MIARASMERIASLILVAVAVGACDDAGSADAFSIEAVGVVQADLIFDADGSGGLDALDEPLSGWTVNLNQPAGGTVASATTDVDGRADFQDVPIGRLVAAVPTEELGDTLDLVAGSDEPFTLAALQTVGVAVLLTLPSYSLEEVRGLPGSVPLFVEGVALNSSAAGDRSLHLKGESGYLRVLSVEEGAAALGDSVRVRGRSTRQDGVPVLDGQAVYRVGLASSLPQPISLSTGEAAGARGGSLDAALVRVSDAEILDVTGQGEKGVVLTVDDGSGPLSLRFGQFLNVDPDLIDPETDVLAFCDGLLVPARVGDRILWEIRPRALADVAIGPGA